MRTRDARRGPGHPAAARGGGRRAAAGCRRPGSDRARLSSTVLRPDRGGPAMTKAGHPLARSGPSAVSSSPPTPTRPHSGRRRSSGRAAPRRPRRRSGPAARPPGTGAGARHFGVALARGRGRSRQRRRLRLPRWGRPSAARTGVSVADSAAERAPAGISSGSLRGLMPISEKSARSASRRRELVLGERADPPAEQRAVAGDDQVDADARALAQQLDQTWSVSAPSSSSPSEVQEALPAVEQHDDVRQPLVRGAAAARCSPMSAKPLSASSS